MRLGMLAAALRDQVERAGTPLAEAGRVETVGLGPELRIVVGTVEVQQDAPALREAVALPLEVLAHPRRDQREERIVAPHLESEARQRIRLAAPDRHAGSRVARQRMRGEGDEAGDGEDRPEQVEQLHRRYLRVHQLPAGVAVEGDGLERRRIRGRSGAPLRDLPGQHTLQPTATRLGPPVAGPERRRAVDHQPQIARPLRRILRRQRHAAPLDGALAQDPPGLVVQHDLPRPLAPQPGAPALDEDAPHLGAPLLGHQRQEHRLAPAVGRAL